MEYREKKRIRNNVWADASKDENHQMVVETNEPTLTAYSIITSAEDCIKEFERK